jgi:small GTP-binding protein
VGGDAIRLQIWDTAGQERFRSISKSYFRNAVGAVLVYDITSMASFDDLADWLSELQGLAMPNAYIILVGNKADLEHAREVGSHFVKDFADKHRLAPVETSALSGAGVREAFARLGFEVYQRVRNNDINVAAPRAIARDIPQPRPGGCCGSKRR